MTSAIPKEDVQALVGGYHRDPFRWLGRHSARAGKRGEATIRALVPGARAVSVVSEDGSVEMDRLHPDGLFETAVPDDAGQGVYRLRIEQKDGGTETVDDPYGFPSTLGELDLHLMGEGTDLRLYEKLGAHLMDVAGVGGTRFAVWAPNAHRVSVVGDFNGWDGRRHPMRLHPGPGVWELFLPSVGEGEVYKYEVLPQGGGAPFLKGDPVGFRFEHRPGTAAVVADLTVYDWEDGEWMAERHTLSVDRPMATYEVHLGSWRRGSDGEVLGYRELAHQLADYVTEMGFTHVELLPVMEHPYDPSWGYQVTGYYAPTSRFGKPDDFRYFVDHLHQRGIGVILDWVPAHFPKDAAGLRRFDGTALYEHEDPRLGEHPDWGTLVFNFGRNEVRNFLQANALFWLREYHIDGLRVDAVASMLYLDYSRKAGEWLPNRYGGRENLEAIEFLKGLNTAVREHFPGALMIAEESTAWPMVTQPAHLGGLGFHLKWNMGWMNDFLRFVSQDPVHRAYHFNLVTFSLMYAFSENFVLPLSHDEVVHGKGSLIGKMPGDNWQKFANLRLALGYMWGHPGKKLLFMGGEIGQWGEWTEGRGLNWEQLDHPLHRGMQRLVRDLNRLYHSHAALWEVDFAGEGFEWIDFHDTRNSVISFARKDREGEDHLVFVCNFTPVVRESYRIGAPRSGSYQEVLNSDAECYGGSNVGNFGSIDTEPIPAHGRDHSFVLTLPPLGLVVLGAAPGGEDETKPHDTDESLNQGNSDHEQ